MSRRASTRTVVLIRGSKDASLSNTSVPTKFSFSSADLPPRARSTVNFKKRRRRSARANPSLLRILLTCSRTESAEILSGMRFPSFVYLVDSRVPILYSLEYAVNIQWARLADRLRRNVGTIAAGYQPAPHRQECLCYKECPQECGHCSLERPLHETRSAASLSSRRLSAQCHLVFRALQIKHNG